jgi:8-oxoguanine deaminase
VVEDEDAILADTQRLIETAPRPRPPRRMLRVVVAPCSPFSVSRDLMRESAELARSHGVRLHTHLAENDHDMAYSREKFGCTPTEYAESLGWLGDDVWHAHCVKLDDAGISLFAATGTGVAHCPCSNMRLASGIAPVRACSTPACRWAWAWTAAPATTPRTCSTRPAGDAAGRVGAAAAPERAFGCDPVRPR